MSRGHSYHSNGKHKYIAKHQRTDENKLTILDHVQERKKKETENDRERKPEEQTSSVAGDKN